MELSQLLILHPRQGDNLRNGAGNLCLCPVPLSDRYQFSKDHLTSDHKSRCYALDARISRYRTLLLLSLFGKVAQHQASHRFFEQTAEKNPRFAHVMLFTRCWAYHPTTFKTNVDSVQKGAQNPWLFPSLVPDLLLSGATRVPRYS